MTLSTIPQTMTVVVPIEPLPDEEAFRLNVNVSMTVRVSADTARRKVSQYVMRHVSHLIGGTDPQLVWQDEAAQCRAIAF